MIEPHQFARHKSAFCPGTLVDYELLKLERGLVTLDCAARIQ